MLQVQNGVERLIGFGSFVLDSVQHNYCTTWIYPGCEDTFYEVCICGTPLYDIMEPSDTFRLGTAQEKSFNEQRQKPVEAAVLAYPNS